MTSAGASRKASWLVGFGLFFVFGLFLFDSNPPHNRRRQPIRYNHAVHVANGLECVGCHVGARDAAQATLPGIDTCLMCHTEALTESTEEEKIRAYAAAGEEIPWQQVTRVPAHVYFSHRGHVALGGMECDECHGPMETLTEPPRRPFRDLNMDACMACHEQKKVRNDCNDCHR